jgi:hypothetical protein
MKGGRVSGNTTNTQNRVSELKKEEADGWNSGGPSLNLGKNSVILNEIAPSSFLTLPNIQ